MQGPNALTVVVSGPPGSGKTTVSAAVGRSLRWPVLSKDSFKEVLFDILGTGDRAWSQTLGRAAVELLVRTSCELSSAATSHLLDVNFIAARDGPQVARVLAGATTPFHVRCEAPLHILEERFASRARLPDRHPGHLETSQLDTVRSRLAAKEWDLELPCPTLVINTDDVNPTEACRVVTAELCRRAAPDVKGSSA